MAIVENPRVFLADFGLDVTLTPTTGAAKATRGLFDDASSMGAGMGSSAPQLTVPSVDVPPNISGGTVAIAGTASSDGTYRIDHPEADGTGWTVLVLERA